MFRMSSLIKLQQHVPLCRLTGWVLRFVILLLYSACRQAMLWQTFRPCKIPASLKVSVKIWDFLLCLHCLLLLCRQHNANIYLTSLTYAHCKKSRVVSKLENVFLTGESWLFVPVNLLIDSSLLLQTTKVELRCRQSFREVQQFWPFG